MKFQTNWTPGLGCFGGFHGPVTTQLPPAYRVRRELCFHRCVSCSGDYPWPLIPGRSLSNLWSQVLSRGCTRTRTGKGYPRTGQGLLQTRQGVPPCEQDRAFPSSTGSTPFVVTQEVFLVEFYVNYELVENYL